MSGTTIDNWGSFDKSMLTGLQGSGKVDHEGVLASKVTEVKDGNLPTSTVKKVLLGIVTFGLYNIIDTIVHSVDGELIADIPVRNEYYQGQTPQSFNALRLKALFQELAESDKAVLTDACKILVLKGEPVALVKGDEANMKLTYTNDMRVARAMLDDRDEDA